MVVHLIGGKVHPIPTMTLAHPTKARIESLTKARIDPQYPAFVAQCKRQAAEAENARTQGIRALASAGDEEIVEGCVKDLDCSVETAALRLGKAETMRQEARQAAREELAKSVVAPGHKGDGDAESNRALAKSILARSRTNQMADADTDSNRALARSILARARRAEDSKVIIE